MAGGDLEKEVLELLTKDIKDHRDYIQRLYRNAFVIGGTALVISLGVVYWFLGAQFDSKVIDYFVDKRVTERIDIIASDKTEEAESNIRSATIKAQEIAEADIERAINIAKEKAVQTVEEFSSERISTIVDKTISDKLEKITGEDIVSLVEKVKFPTGTVLIVDSPQGCPLGWYDMAKREPHNFTGRAIVAVGSATGRETRIYRQNGGSEVVALTQAEMPSHSHTISDPKHQHGEDWLESFDGTQDGWYGRTGKIGGRQDHHEATGISINPIGGNQPHNNMPPYIALYFCKKG